MQLCLIEGLEEQQHQADMAKLHILRLARAAEHLVCADILERGFNAQMASEGLPYDVIADIGGLRRIQVKSTQLRRRPVTVRGKGYDYSVYRFNAGGRLRDYCGMADLLAFVAVDRRMIVYARPENMSGDEMRILPDKMTPEYCNLSWTSNTGMWRP